MLCKRYSDTWLQAYRKNKSEFIILLYCNSHWKRDFCINWPRTNKLKIHSIGPGRIWCACFERFQLNWRVFPMAPGPEDREWHVSNPLSYFVLCRWKASPFAWGFSALRRGHRSKGDTIRASEQSNSSAILLRLRVSMLWLAEVLCEFQPARWCQDSGRGISVLFKCRLSSKK